MSGICLTPGCTDPVYRDVYGKAGWYCRNTHRLWGEKGCVLCRRAEKVGCSKFCQACKTAVSGIGPILVQVPKDNRTYHSVANQFQKSWRHPTHCPTIQTVYGIVGGQEVVDRYNEYRDVVESRGGFTAKGLTPGNQQRQWHGTNRGCNIGDNGRKTGWGRFGNGIYTSSISSKSNDYSDNLVPSPWKAILLTYVVVGKVKKFTTNQPMLTQAPVIGKASPTGSLNYDELIVYTNDAVRPAYLVIYGS